MRYDHVKSGSREEVTKNDLCEYALAHLPAPTRLWSVPSLGCGRGASWAARARRRRRPITGDHAERDDDEQQQQRTQLLHWDSTATHGRLLSLCDLEVSRCPS